MPDDFDPTWFEQQQAALEAEYRRQRAAEQEPAPTEQEAS